MAASMNWCRKLNEHKIFEKLREKTGNTSDIRHSKDIVKLYDSELFIYNQAECTIFTTSLQLLSRDSCEADCNRYQILVPNSPPIHDVTSMQFSFTGTSLALVGPRGISVLTVPQRWGKHALYEGGKEKVLSKTVTVGERLFVSDVRLQVQQVQWHPGSKSDSHLAMLTSDCCLRIFDIREPEAEEQTINLRDQSTPDELPSRISIFNTTGVLGETPIAFDFGPCCTLEKKVARPDQGDGPASRDGKEEKAWPVFLLKGNGDVCVLFTQTDSYNILQHEVLGPLAMYPPAEDNYGTDACSILCIPSSPPVLVVATSAGTLYHCAVLEKDMERKGDAEGSSHMTEYSKQFKPLPSYSLYVYETVELELGVSTATEPEDETVLEYSCPVKLHRDPLVVERYHCAHDAGVHTVMLPWLHKLKQFCQEDDSDLLLLGGADEHAVVEHLICTRPLAASPPAPILGLCLTTDRLLGLALIVATDTYQCITLPLKFTYQAPPPPLLSESPAKKVVSPLRKLQKQPFEAHIQQILQRSTSSPLLKGHGDLNQKELLQVLGGTTQVLRQEYLQKFETAHREIRDRVKMLQQRKKLQQQELDKALAARASLRNSAESLAEKYEEASDKQKEITHRLEKVISAIEQRVPVLSDAERNMQKELKDIKEQLQQLKLNLQQVKQKQQYQSRVTSQEQRTHASSPGLGKQQMVNIRNMLKREGDEIAELVQKVKELQVSAGP